MNYILPKVGDVLMVVDDKKWRDIWTWSIIVHGPVQPGDLMLVSHVADVGIYVESQYGNLIIFDYHPNGFENLGQLDPPKPLVDDQYVDNLIQQANVITLNNFVGHISERVFTDVMKILDKKGII